MKAQLKNSRFMRFFGISSIGTVADYLTALFLYSVLGLSGVAASTRHARKRRSCFVNAARTVDPFCNVASVKKRVGDVLASTLVNSSGATKTKA